MSRQLPYVHSRSRPIPAVPALYRTFLFSCTCLISDSLASPSPASLLPSSPFPSSPPPSFFLVICPGLLNYRFTTVYVILFACAVWFVVYLTLSFLLDVVDRSGNKTALDLLTPLFKAPLRLLWGIWRFRPYGRDGRCIDDRYDPAPLSGCRATVAENLGPFVFGTVRVLYLCGNISEPGEKWG